MTLTFKIINLSKRELNQTEINLLEKGLKFTPTPVKTDSQEITEDLAEFTRKVRLAEYFHDCEDTDISFVKNKSNFVPPKNRNQALDEFIKSVENIPLNSKDKRIKDHLSRHERNSI